MNDSPWNSQGVGQYYISGIDRLIYHHSVYSDNILMCLSQGWDFRYQASHCWQHFVKTPVTLQAYSIFLNSNIPIFCSCVEKVLCICNWSVYCPSKKRPPPFHSPNANSLCGHKLIGLGYAMPPPTTAHHHPPSPNTSQNISTTTHHHPPPAKIYLPSHITAQKWTTTQ